MANPTGKAVPDKVKERRGTNQPSRMNPNQPVYGSDAIKRTPTRWKDKRLRKLWRDMVPALIASGVAQDVDRAVLERYVYQAYLAEKMEVELVNENGTVNVAVATDNGSVKTNPVWTAYMRLSGSLRSLAGEFGMTPASRQRIEALPPAKVRFDSLSEGADKDSGAPGKPAAPPSSEPAPDSAVIDFASRHRRRKD